MLITHIKFWVLNKLNEKDHSGYELMQEIGELIGKKPSPGYMYPLLNDLLNKKFVSVKKEGRKKIYHLTKEGKEFLNDSLKQHKNTSKNIINIFRPLVDKKEAKEISKIQNLFFKDKDTILRDMDLHMELFKNIFKIYQKNNNKRLELRKILKETISKLKKLT